MRWKAIEFGVNVTVIHGTQLLCFVLPHYPCQRFSQSQHILWRILETSACARFFSLLFGFVLEKIQINYRSCVHHVSFSVCCVHF